MDYFVIVTFPRVAFWAAPKLWVSNPRYAAKFKTLGEATIASWTLLEATQILSLVEAYELLEG